MQTVHNLIVPNEQHSVTNNGLTADFDGLGSVHIYGTPKTVSSPYGLGGYGGYRNVTPGGTYTYSTDVTLPDGVYIGNNSFNISTGTPIMNGGYMYSGSSLTFTASTDSDGRGYVFIGINNSLKHPIDVTLRIMLVEGTTPAAWAPAEGETLAGGGALMSANLWDESTANRKPDANGVYLSGKTAGALSCRYSATSALTDNQTVHMGASLRGADKGSLTPYAGYMDAAGHVNFTGYPKWAPTDEWQRFEGSCVVPSGMKVVYLGFDTYYATGDIEVTNPTFSLGSPVSLAVASHTPYATEGHLEAVYATQASLKVTSDAVTAEVEERGKLAGRVGTLESTSGTHTSKLEQLATSIKSLVKGESTYTDPDGASATSGIYSLVTQTRDSVTALFGQYTKTDDLAATDAVKDAKKAGTDAASAASAAQSTADTAKDNAATAQSTADRAQSTADAALDNAGTANGNVKAVEARVSASIDGLDVRVRGVSEAVSAQGATVRDVERNMSFGLDGLVIGAADSASKVRITEKRETFEVDGKTVLALDGDTSTVEASALKIGGYVWTATNGGKNLTLVYRG